jgi:hypothetical protein
MQHHHNDLRNQGNHQIRGIDDFIALLNQHGCRPRRSGSGWVALCPNHECDGQKHSPSLSVKTGQDGRILVHCFAGCSTERIIAALGLRLSDLMPPPSRLATSNRSCQASAKQDSDSAEPRDSKAFASAEDAIAALARQLRCEPTHKWVHLNARGETIAYAVRFDPPSGQGKIIRYVSLRETGWQIRGIPEPRPPYRLTEIRTISDRDCLVITEAEKTADAAVRCGLIATTSAGGAEAASKTSWALLEPASWRRIVILPDNDEPGEKYADDVARLLWAAGARDIRILRLVDYAKQLPEGGDLADNIESPNFYELLSEGAALADLGRWVLQTAEQTACWEPEITASYLQWEPYPTEQLPSPFCEFVRETAKAIGCDESFVALPLLAETAAAIGTTRVLELKPTWRVPSVVLWGVIIGESGSLKTAALWAALEWAHERETALQLQFQNEWQEYEAALERWKQNADIADSKPKPPVARRLLIQDITIEALAPVLKANPRGVLLARDELAAWLRAFDKYSINSKGAEAPNWLSLYSAKSITIDRKTSGTIHVPIAAVSIAGGIQPHVLKRALSNENRENGLAARLLMAMPPRCRKRWTDATVDSMTSKAVKQVLGKLFALEHEYSPVGQDGNSAGHCKPEVVRLSQEAKLEYVAFYNKHAERLENAAGDWSSALSKLEELPARLALVIHMVKWANGEAVKQDEVDADSMQRAIHLTRWHIHETQRIYQFLDATESEEIRWRLLEWIRRRGGSTTVRELYSSGPREYRNNPAAAEEALNNLVKAGWGYWQTETRRPTRVFSLFHNKPGDTEAEDGDGYPSGAPDDGTGGPSSDWHLVPPSLDAVDADAVDAPNHGDRNLSGDTNLSPGSFASASSASTTIAASGDTIDQNDVSQAKNRPYSGDTIRSGACKISGMDAVRCGDTIPSLGSGDTNRSGDTIPSPGRGQLADAERELLAWLRRQDKPVTLRDVQRGLRAMRRQDVAMTALDKLAVLGFGQWESTSTGGRGRTVRRFRLTQPAAEPASGEVEPATAPGQEAGLTAEPATEAATEDTEPAPEAEPALELAPLEILNRAMRLPAEWRERFWQLFDAVGRCPLPDRATRAYRQLLAELPRELSPILAAAPRVEPNRPSNAVITAMLAKLKPKLQQRFWQLYDRHAGKHPRKELLWLAWQELQCEITQDTDPDAPQNRS